MKKILFLIVLSVLTSCGSKSKDANITTTNYSSPTTAESYINTITGLTCEKAAMTDNGFLVIAIDATSDSGYDNLASQFLDEAKREGVADIEGVMIVDIKDCEFQKGAVVGKRIGKAFN